MADKEITITPMGGINQDDSPFVPPAGSGGISPFEQGDYRYALNCRIGSSSEDNASSVENIPSTLEISNYWTWNGSAFVSGSAPAGTNTALNKYEDRENNTFYWFVKNSNNDHQILKFVKHENKIYEMLKWDGLNFNTFISVCKIGQYLIFTDNSNAPRIINTENIYDLKYTLGSDFSEYHISFAKWAPIMPPLIKADTGQSSDFMKKGAFQFSYRYVYVGGFKSTLSPPSPFCTNQTYDQDYVFEVSLPGYIYDKENDSYFTHESIKFYEIVEYIELVYRESSIQPWKMFQRHKVESSGNQTFYFSNNGNIAIIPAIEGTQYSDSVPFLSGSCEAIDNRPMFANNTDELEVPEFAVENVQVYSEDVGDSWNASGALFSGLSGGQQAIKTAVSQLQQFTFKEGGIYKLGILYQHHSGRTGLVISPDNWIYQIPRPTLVALNPDQFEKFHALGFTIPGTIDPPEWATSYQIVRTNCLNMEFFIQGVCNDVLWLGKTTTPSSSLTDFGTMPTVIQDIINANINADASQNEIDRARMLASAYREDISVSDIDDASRIYFDCNNWINQSSKNAGGTQSNVSNNVFYNFKQGDRIRYVGVVGGVLTWIDEEIIEFTGRGFIVNKRDDVTFLPKIADALWYSWYQQIEIYRPKVVNDQDNFLFYEIGEWYPITDPGTISRDFAKRDFSWTDRATVTAVSYSNDLYPVYSAMPVYTGDTWIVNKSFYFNYYSAASGKSGVAACAYFMQMNEDPKNAGGAWNHNQGRPFIAYEYIPTQFIKETQIRFGNKFLEDSLFIGINTFLDRNQFIYPGEYGKIRAMVNTSNAQVQSVGNVLLVIGEQESWSVYVNRTTLEDLSGRSQVAISDKVLGSFNTLLGSNGTLNPESISKESERVLWWNERKGVWVRYSRDGLTEISKFGMKNWFKDLSDLINSYYYTGSEVPKALSIFDDYHEEWITTINHSLLPATFKGYDSYKCVSFAERNADKRWKSWYDYLPDLFAGLDNQTYSIIGSVVHQHEGGADFGSFYGVKKDSILEFIANPEYRKNKIWKAITLTSSDRWSFPSILGDWKSNGGTRQQSEILLAQLKNLEGSYWSPVRKDGNSPNAVNFEEGVVKGNTMRSKTLLLQLMLDPDVTYYSLFHWLNVSYDMSEQNPKI
jgi:hypothetical protein